MRSFLALPLSFDTAQKLYENRELLRLGYRGLKWIKPDHFHVTLFFFEAIDRNQIGEIIGICDRILPDISGFPYELTGPGQFPPKGNPRVIYESLDKGSEDCRRLHKKLNGPLSAVTETEKRKYHPHVTLARVNPSFRNFPQEGTTEPLLPVKGFMNSVIFYESILHKDGALYIPMKEWVLKKTEDDHESS